MRIKNKNRKRFNLTKTILIIVVVAIVVLGAFTLFAELSKKNNTAENSPETSKEDKKDDDQKSQEKDNSSTDDKAKDGGSDIPESPKEDESSGLLIVSPVITYFGMSSDKSQVEASGAIENSTDNSGTCYYVFSGPNGKIMTVESKPLPSARSIACSTVRKDLSEFGSGKWKVKLEYKSEKEKGSSTEVEIEIK